MIAKKNFKKMLKNYQKKRLKKKVTKSKKDVQKAIVNRHLTVSVNTIHNIMAIICSSCESCCKFFFFFNSLLPSINLLAKIQN